VPTRPADSEPFPGVSPAAEPVRVKRPSWYKRLFAYMMANSSTQYDNLITVRKRALLGGLRGNILEIGPGTGPNLAYYSPDVHWLGIEPNPAMIPYIEREAKRLAFPVELRDGSAEHLPTPDESMDAVIGTLVLCSVHDPAKTIQEALRVLKPGGKFVFIEHVAAPAGTRLRRMQAFVRPVWQALSDGCHVDRETWATIESAGFTRVQLEHFRLDAPIVGPHIAGFAVK